MATTSPNFFKAVHPLTKEELLQRAKAVNCTLPKSSKPACSGPIDIGFFFDGTGNNMQADFSDRPPAQRKHSTAILSSYSAPTTKTLFWDGSPITFQG
jgi:hypothetical protein